MYSFPRSSRFLYLFVPTSDLASVLPRTTRRSRHKLVVPSARWTPAPTVVLAAVHIPMWVHTYVRSLVHVQ